MARHRIERGDVQELASVAGVNRTTAARILKSDASVRLDVAKRLIKAERVRKENVAILQGVSDLLAGLAGVARHLNTNEARLELAKCLEAAQAIGKAAIGQQGGSQ